MTDLLVVENAAVQGAAGIVVNPVSLVLEAGRPFTILGETGSGKSLLAQAIMGTLPNGLHATGQIELANQRIDLATGGQRPLWGRAVSVLPQEPWLALDPTMRAQSQVEEGHRFVRKINDAAAKKAARADLEELGLGGLGDRLPMQLSGGMAQRVAFAAARAGGAGIMIADEPTKGLDVARRDEVIALLLREAQEGGGLLTITHDLELARQMGGDIAVMFEGKIIEQGRAEDVLTEPRHNYTKRLIAADPSGWPEPSGQARKGPGTVLDARDLTKTRGGHLLFSGQSISVCAGEIVGITGPSGCGKSTFGDILLNLVPPDSGSVKRGEGIEAIRYQKLYQDPPAAFPPRVSIGQALNDLVRRHRIDATRIGPLLDRLRLVPGLLQRLPGEVSGGELQRLALLRVLLLDPVFLFADEPTSRLDLITQKETIDLLVEVARERGCAVLIVSHDMDLVHKTADRHLSFGARTAPSAGATKRKATALSFV